MHINRRELLRLCGGATMATWAGGIINGGIISGSGGLLLGCGEDQTTAPNLGLTHDSTPPTLGGDPSLSWWLRGNYAPVKDEYDSRDAGDTLEVIGALPPSLNGTLLRNGSNPKSEDPMFWFFGDGMLHGINLGGGEARWYKRSWIKTPAVMGEQSGVAAGRANTSLVRHAGRTLALYEVAPPFEVRPDDLGSVGYHSFDGATYGPMCAHPKVDPRTGEMWFIGVGMFPAELSCTCVSAGGEVLRHSKIPLDAMRMIHDFQLTQRFVVLLDLPVLLNPAFLSGGPMFEWRPDRVARIGLMPRHADLSETRWFEVEASYVFHTFNAYEEGDEVVLEACRLMPNAGDDFFTSTSAPMPWRWSLNLTTGAVREEAIGERSSEFPTIDQRFQGQAHRFNYGLMMQSPTADYPLHPYGLFQQDRLSGEVSAWDLGEAVQLDEAIFVPDSPEAGEGEGWLLSVAYNRPEARSELLVLDAQRVSDGPVARVLLPSRVPFGFHGLWVPEG